MKKTLGVVALLALSLGLAGCDNYVTPKGALETVAINLSKGDVKEFSKGLVGNAATQYASKAGMVTLKAKLTGMKGLRIEDAALVSVTPVRNNGFQTAVKTYTVNVLGHATGAKDIRVIEAVVTCDIFEMDSAMCPTRNSSGRCTFNEQDQFSECKVADLK